jgi:AcrR family transcriptional regulator
MNTESIQRPLREKQRMERLELILQAAEQVFAEKGYRDTSMDEIATRVGIGTATIYAHFPSKEDLMVAAIYVRDLQRIVQRVEAISASNGSAIEKLTNVFHDLVDSDFFKRRTQVVYAMGHTPEAQRALLARQETMTEHASAFSDILTRIIEQGKANREIRPDFSTPAQLKTFIGLIRAQSVTDPLLSRYDASPDEVLRIYLQCSIFKEEP